MGPGENRCAVVRATGLIFGVFGGLLTVVPQEDVCSLQSMVTHEQRCRYYEANKQSVEQKNQNAIHPLYEFFHQCSRRRSNDAVG